MRLFVKDLTVIDSSFLCPDRGLVGESWLVDIELNGSLNQMNMLLDFGVVKKLIKQVIDLEVDHKLLIPADSPLLQVNDEGQRCQLSFKRPQNRTIYLDCPQQAFTFIPGLEIQEDNLTKYVSDCIAQRLPSNITDLKITLRNEKIEGPFYHYSHGLKRHDGNCQRIAHGHRSMLEIFVDGEEDPDLVASWARRWYNIYLGATEDCISLAQTSLDKAQAEALIHSHYAFSYTTEQGLFMLVVPKDECELTDCDTTVENLADYICRQLAPGLNGRAIQVIAYEGVGKGAIAELNHSAMVIKDDKRSITL